MSRGGGSGTNRVWCAHASDRDSQFVDSLLYFLVLPRLHFSPAALVKASKLPFCCFPFWLLAILEAHSRPPPSCKMGGGPVLPHAEQSGKRNVTLTTAKDGNSCRQCLRLEREWWSRGTARWRVDAVARYRGNRRALPFCTWACVCVAGRRGRKERGSSAETFFPFWHFDVCAASPWQRPSSTGLGVAVDPVAY